MKIGADHSALGLSEGIHWHINPDIKVEYIAEGGDRETLPWVRYTNLKTGEVKCIRMKKTHWKKAHFPLKRSAQWTAWIATLARRTIFYRR
ncbi:MAG: hypothetical protein R3C26_03275 [Calditrichia bacterium]